MIGETANRRLRSVILWFAVVLCFGIAVVPMLAPRAPKGDEVGAISVARALEHVASIAGEPHVMGTPEIDVVRRYLIATLAEVGLEPETMNIEAPDYFGSSGGTVNVINVFTRIRGVDSDRAILLMAHYDSVPATPAANDNSAAVAALLEAGRILAAGPPPPNDVIILFTDGEEPEPRFGAWGFAEYHPWFNDVAAAVNLEGISVAGPTTLVELNGPTGSLISRLAVAVPDPVAYSFLTQIADLIGGAATDFDVFRDRGVPGFNFAYMRGASIYHTQRDSIENLNVHGLAHHISLALGISRNLGPLEFDESGSDEAVFFTVPPRNVVRYPTVVGVASGALAMLLLAGALWTRVKRRGSSVRAMWSGLAIVLIFALLSVSASGVIWFGLAKLRPAMGLAESYTYLALLAGMVGVSWSLVRRRALSRGGDATGGLLIVMLVLVLLTGASLPSIGYLFVWPALAVGVAEIVVDRSRSFWMQVVAVFVVALMTFVVLLPAIDIFFILASPRPGNPGSEMPAMVVLSAFLGFLAAGLIASQVSPPIEPSTP